MKNITKPKDREEPYNGYSNFATWRAATYVQNDEHLHDLCKSIYADGYTSWGAMVCKLKEFGTKWQSINNPNELRFGDSTIRAKEMTKVLEDLFSKPNEPRTKR